MEYVPYDYLIKCLIIGDSGIGKSSLMIRFTDDIFNNKYISTIGVDFKIKTVNFNGKNVKYQIWDTAGQERFRTITSSYYRGADAILLCYDITDKKSFLNIDKWFEEVKMFSLNKPQLILCGTKNDLDIEREVEEKEGLEYAQSHNMDFFECSSKNFTGITSIFDKIAKHRMENYIQPKNKNINKTDLRRRSPQVGINLLLDPSEISNKKTCCY
jgi:small GTP-binding protein